MRYVIDTHVLLWCFSDFEKLPEKVQNILRDSQNTILVSSVTIWEIAIKRALKKLDTPDNIQELIARYQFQPLEISFAHAAQVEFLPPFHADPFDRLLIAQSQHENIPIISRDTIIPQYDVTVIW